MRKLLLFLFIAISTSLLFSCSKESITKKNLEGTWGLTHYERIVKKDGIIQFHDKGDFNPLAPVDENDSKFVFINTTGNDYLITVYSWHEGKGIWDVHEEDICTIEGNKMYWRDKHSEYEGIIKFHLTSDSLTLEYSDEGEGIVGEKIEIYTKHVLKKMSDLTE